MPRVAAVVASREVSARRGRPRRGRWPLVHPTRPRSRSNGSSDAVQCCRTRTRRRPRAGSLPPWSPGGSSPVDLARPRRAPRPSLRADRRLAQIGSIPRALRQRDTSCRIRAGRRVRPPQTEPPRVGLVQVRSVFPPERRVPAARPHPARATTSVRGPVLRAYQGRARAATLAACAPQLKAAAPAPGPPPTLGARPASSDQRGAWQCSHLCALIADARWPS